MDITINLDGTIKLSDVHNGDGVAAAQLIRELRGDANKKRVSDKRSESMTLAAQKIDTGTGELNAIQYRTWQYLVDHDCAGGIHVSEVAHAFGITANTANSRLLVLFSLGFVTRIRKGYYRAIDTGNGTSETDG